MSTAEEIRNELANLKTQVQADVDNYVRQGYVNRGVANEFLTTVGLQVDDEEAQAARRELDQFRGQLEQAIHRFAPTQYRSNARQRWGLANVTS